jgi:hypothetical protein
MSLSLICLLNLQDYDLTSGKVGSTVSTIQSIVFTAGLVIYLPIYLFYHAYTKWPIEDTEFISKYGTNSRKKKEV